VHRVWAIRRVRSNYIGYTLVWFLFYFCRGFSVSFFRIYAPFAIN